MSYKFKTPQTSGQPKQVQHARAPKVKVMVSGETITNAIKGDSSHCMIAEAVKAAVPNATKISVDLQTIRFSDPERRRRYVYLTPRRAQEALVEFDQGRVIEPFEILLRGAHVLAIKSSPKAKTDEVKAPLRKRVAMRKNGDHIPEVVGGKAPPLASLASPSFKIGRRREYGLRALER